MLSDTDMIHVATIFSNLIFNIKFIMSQIYVIDSSVILLQEILNYNNYKHLWCNPMAPHGATMIYIIPHKCLEIIICKVQELAN